METILLILFIFLVVFLFQLKSRQGQLLQQNENLFKHLKNVLNKLADVEDKLAELNSNNNTTATSTTITEDKPSATVSEDTLDWRPVVPIPQNQIVSAGEAEESLAETDASGIALKQEHVLEDKETAIAVAAYTDVQPVAATPPIHSPGWWERWVANNPDIEKFVGENLANKIGIAILVLGIGFFVKYAIDKDWIKETGRVVIGLSCGIGMIAIAHYLRNSYRSFSSVLAGGAIAVFYFTISFAFHEYQLFSQQAAFVIMLVITVFAVAISLLYNKLELAVIAVAGGFIAPFLVSNGSGNYVVLFTYMIILNAGILSISYYKKWPLLHIQAFFFTQVIFISWLMRVFVFSYSSHPVAHALGFATVFYLLFAAIVLIYHLKHQRPFKALDYSLLLLTTFCYYGCAMLVLDEWDNGQWNGLFTLLMSVCNLGLAWWLFKRQQHDKPLLYLLIGLTLTFLSLAAPVQLSGGHITVFWAAETTLMYWLFTKSGLKVFRLSSFIVLALMIISLLMDWSNANANSNGVIPLVFDSWSKVIHLVVVIVSLACYIKLLFFNSPDTFLFNIKTDTTARIMTIGLFVLVLVLGIGIVNLRYRFLQSFDIPNVYHQLYIYLLGVSLCWINQRRRRVTSIYFGITLVLACFLFYLASVQNILSLANGVVLSKYSAKHLWMFGLATGLLFHLFYRQVQQNRQHSSQLQPVWVWIFCFVLLFAISLSCRIIYVNLLASSSNINTYITQFSKAGLTIVWAICAFLAIWLGMRFKSRLLRIVSLFVFSAALVKLFLFDIRNISAGGKIAAFIMLGVLLLVISFMYQRLKNIITNEENSV